MMSRNHIQDSSTDSTAQSAIVFTRLFDSPLQVCPFSQFQQYTPRFSLENRPPHSPTMPSNMIFGGLTSLWKIFGRRPCLYLTTLDKPGAARICNKEQSVKLTSNEDQE